MAFLMAVNGKDGFYLYLLLLCAQKKKQEKGTPNQFFSRPYHAAEQCSKERKSDSVIAAEGRVIPTSPVLCKPRREVSHRLTK